MYNEVLFQLYFIANLNYVGYASKTLLAFVTVKYLNSFRKARETKEHSSVNDITVFCFRIPLESLSCLKQQIRISGKVNNNWQLVNIDGLKNKFIIIIKKICNITR